MTLGSMRPARRQFRRRRLSNSSFRNRYGKEKNNDEKKEVENGQLKTQNSLEVPAELTKESVPVVNGSEEPKVAENGSIASGDAPKGAKPVVSEKRVVANGVANGC